MRMRFLAILALIAAFAMFVPTVWADHDDDHHGRGKHADRYWDDDDDDGWAPNGAYEVRVYRVYEGMPPGWREGRKTGWGNCGLPPRQAKKYGCRTYVYERRRYYYYYDDDDRIVIRRPRISIHAVIH